LSLEVREARDRSEVEEALELRRRVFCEEQGVTPAADRDGRDGEALHLVAVEDGAVVGTCRLLLDGERARLGRMAVEADRRGRGIGAHLLEATERAAVRAGARRVTLHAQSAAVSLYARGGYEPRGERFLEEGIEHVRMEKCLSSG
jgi:predicted GNAT family N-acyltransferase